MEKAYMLYPALQIFIFMVAQDMTSAREARRL
jgi:hypothetical protein